MRIALLSMLCWLLALPLSADQSNLILVVEGVSYSNVTFKTVTPTTVSIVHQTGAATIPLEKLPPDLQKQFKYDPQKAAEYRLALAPQSVRTLMPDAGRSSHISTVTEDMSNRPDAFGVTGSPFAAYDKTIVAAVEKRWYALIDHYGIKDSATVVTVHFQIFKDGHLEDVKVLGNTGGQILALFCEKAIIDSGPFDPLPADLVVRAGKGPRDVRFTFSY
jgi:hypothetical protein